MEFGVYLVRRDEEPFYVDGRCHEGTIRVGDRFRSTRSASDGVASPADLEVVRIEAYRLTMEFIDEGQTARLFVRGIGLDRLEKGSVLTG